VRDDRTSQSTHRHSCFGLSSSACPPRKRGMNRFQCMSCTVQQGRAERWGWAAGFVMWDQREGHGADSVDRLTVHERTGSEEFEYLLPVKLENLPISPRVSKSSDQ